MVAELSGLARISRAISICSLFVALAILVGWIADVSWLNTGIGGTVAVKPNTAICLTLISVALIVLSSGRPTETRRRIVQGLIAVSLLICLATMAEYAFGLNLRLDQALFADQSGAQYPGRMSPNTTVGLFLLGLGVMFVSTGNDNQTRVGHIFAIGSAIIALLGTVGYLYNAAEFYQIESAIAMAPFTAADLFALSGALFWASRDLGLMRVISSENAAGFLVRRLLPPVVLVPIALGWLCLQGLSRGLFDKEAGIGLLVTANIITLGVLIAVNSHVLFRADTARSRSQEQLRANIASIENRIAERTAELRLTAAQLSASERRFALAVDGADSGILDYDLVTMKLFCSPRWKALLGVPESEPFDSPRAFLRLVHPADRERAMSLLTGHFKASTPTFSTEVRMRHRDGSYRWMLSRGQAVRDENGLPIRMVGSQTDISELKSLQERLLAESIHDSMTGLFNRRHFEDRLAVTVQTAARHGRPLSVCICDVDDFKGINDKYGHPTGDSVLQSLAGILRTETRAGDIVARYGGDEFCILFPEVSAANSALCAERIRNRLEKTQFVSPAGDRFQVTASFGLGDLKDTTAAQLIGEADRRLYAAKARGRNQLAAAE
jgi:diguanylate cyclase (GGDEF)-like protein/PAS domain S-box-containing protein